MTDKQIPHNILSPSRNKWEQDGDKYWLLSFILWTDTDLLKKVQYEC